MQIRPYLEKDYEEVKNILVESDIFDSDMDKNEILKNKIKKDPNSILVAEENEIIGCIYIINDEWFGGVFRLAVKECHRGKDVGKQLLEKAEQYLKSKGHSQIMLFVNNKFDKLIEWYKKQGYKHTENNFKALWKDI